MTVAAQSTRSVGFWFVTGASLFSSMASAGSASAMARLVETIGGTAVDAGLLVSLAALSSIIAMPVSGAVADRIGYKPVVIIGSVMSVVGLLITLTATNVILASVARVIFGLGNAAAASTLMAWVVSAIPLRERGRALSLFGISIWVAVAIGPQLGETAYQHAGIAAIWIGCVVAVAFSLGAVLPVTDPSHGLRLARAGHSPSRLTIQALRGVLVPGVVAALAWSCEGFLLGFLIIHLEANGLPPEGLLGAAGVFGVFAASVIGTRLILGGLPDRLGAVVTATGSLVALAAGMATLGFASEYWIAAVGAVLVGVGFAPLYPALVMLATDRLDPRHRAAGIGIFSGFTSAGYALGALLGGALIGWFGAQAAFAAIAGLPVVALLLLRIPRRSTSSAEPSPRASMADDDQPLDPDSAV